MAIETLYKEQYRPQFHFSAKKNWLNDPNGCVFFEGEYHLFFQHNPEGREWGNMTWGHAISKDLVHWQQLPHAIEPYGGGTIFSGSAVVDFENTSGLGDGDHPPMVAVFTHARTPFGQAIAFSKDKGRTWTLYNNGEHVVPNQGLDESERDPKVFWHVSSQKWIMVLWVQKGQVRFFTSDNLTTWTHSGDFIGGDFFECPDLFALPVDGDTSNMKWVLHDAAFNYYIGDFDGKSFACESGPFRGDYGVNFYAAQTWNNTGKRVTQIAWMRGGDYPDMPFNQQMSFPCDLTLRTLPQGIHLCRTPVPEIECLYGTHFEIENKKLYPGDMMRVEPEGSLFNIRLEVEISREADFHMHVYDEAISYSNGKITLLGTTAPLEPLEGVLKIQILVDRTSMELFGNEGALSMSSCFMPKRRSTTIQCHTEHAAVHIRSLLVDHLASIWH